MPKEPRTPIRRSPRFANAPPIAASASPPPATSTRTARTTALSSTVITRPRPGPAPLSPPSTPAHLGRRLSTASVFSVLSAESEALPDITDFFKKGTDRAPLSKKPSAESTAINQMREILLETGNCSICGLFMRRPYITQCGHTWCSHCLKRHFQTQLRKRILKYGKDSHQRLSHEPVSCTTVPNSGIAQLKLVNALRHHDCDVRKIFQYKCPLCRALITREPVLNYALACILEKQVKILNVSNVAVPMTEGEEGERDNIDMEPFPGLFYP